MERMAIIRKLRPLLTASRDTLNNAVLRTDRIGGNVVLFPFDNNTMGVVEIGMHRGLKPLAVRDVCRIAVPGQSDLSQQFGSCRVVGRTCTSERN